MAEFRSWDPFDLRTVDFAASYSSAVGSFFDDNINRVVHGVTYEDRLVIDHSTDTFTTTEEWYGSGITVVAPDVTGGTLTAFYHWFVKSSDGLWYYNFEARGFSISALDLYNAQLSVSRADDQVILSQMLSGNDLIDMNSTGADYVEGRGGNDTMWGGLGRDTLLGGAGNDRVHGEAGNDLLRGLNGADYLSGGNGADRLIGDFGDDVLRGGTDSARDVFVFGVRTGHDTIKDFQDGVDRIEFVTGPTAFGQLHLSQSGSGVLVQFQAMSVLVENTTVAALTAHDFLFT